MQHFRSHLGRTILVGLIESMHKTISFILSISIIFISCFNHTKQSSSDFLERANIFWKHAISNNCIELVEMVRYPILMDGMSIDDEIKLMGQCNAIYTSAKYLKDKKGISPDNLTFDVNVSGWLKKEIIESHSLLKIHIGNDVSFFLLEVISSSYGNKPITFIFRRDYNDKDGGWDIIMLEDYSLTEILKKR